MAGANLNHEANNTRLNRLLIGKGTEALRKIFDTFYSSSTLPTFLKAHKALLLKYKVKVIKKNQWKLLFPTSGNPDSKKFDISLLSILLLNTCGLKPPATGWSTMPPEADTTVEAHIVRLRVYRNEIYAHAANTGITDDEFEDLWTKISQTLIELGASKAEIEELRNSPLGPAQESYIETLKRWELQDNKMQKILHEVKTFAKKVLKTTHEIKESMSENTRKLQESMDNNKTEIKKSVAEGMKELMDKKLAEPSSKQDKNLLLKLSKFNFNGDVEELAQLFHPGTRKWLFAQIENWFLTKGPNVFILTAGPGVGKSVLAAKIIQKYQEKEELVACHFCKFNNSNYSNPIKLIQSLASHICDSVKGFREKLLEQLKRPYDVNNLQDAFQVYLKEPLQDLPRMKTMLVVIDGLDECERRGKSDLLKVLAEEFSKLPTWLKVLVTSRPEINVKEKTSSLKCIDILHTDKNNEEDIKEYLMSQLSNLLHQDISKLTEECEGSFLFAFYLVDHLRKLGHNITKKDVMNPLPKGINTVYLHYFERLEEQLRKVSEQYDISHLLMILVVSFHPIPLSFFTEGLKLAPNWRQMKQIIANVNETISNLLYVSDNMVTPYHKSVVDWLTKKGHKYTVDYGEGSGLLWKIVESKFNEIKEFFDETNGSNFDSFVKNTTIMYALKNGFQELFGAANHSNVGVNFEWLVDIFLLHAMSEAGLHEECMNQWRYFLRKGEFEIWDYNGGSSTMMTIKQKVRWNFEHFLNFELRPIYVQEFFNESPEEIFSGKEKHIAKNILDSHVHFWCEKLGHLNLAASVHHVTACAFSPDGSNLVTCAKDSRICIWNINSLQIVKEVFSNCKNSIRCFWSEGEEILIFYYAEDAEDAEDDLMLSRYTVQLEKKSDKKLAKNSDTPLAFSAQAFVFKCSTDSSIKVTRFTEKNQTTISIRDLGYMLKFAVTHDGSSILATDKDHFEVWNISGTSSTEYNLAKSEKFGLDEHEHKNCDCITEVLSCAISNCQTYGIISYFCSEMESPYIIVIDMDVEHPGQVDNTWLVDPTDENLHFELIESNNGNIVCDGDDNEDNDDDDYNDTDDDVSDLFYFVQSYKRITVYSNKRFEPLTHLNHEGDPDYYKESSICRSGNIIALPQQSGGVCMVKLHLPKTNEKNLNSRWHQFTWRWQVF